MMSPDGLETSGDSDVGVCEFGQSVRPPVASKRPLCPLLLRMRMGVCLVAF